jgi:hypothetical protein
LRGILQLERSNTFTISLVRMAGVQALKETFGEDPRSHTSMPATPAAEAQH